MAKTGCGKVGGIMGMYLFYSGMEGHWLALGI